MAAGCFGSFKHLVLDEIALEGLEGVSISGLWINLSIRLQCKLPLSDKIKNAAWSYIQEFAQELEFYELPKEQNDKEINDRFKDLDASLGVPIVQGSYPDSPYKFSPVENDEIWGSCENYKDRLLIPVEEIRNTELQDAIDRWGRKLAIVAKQNMRLNALLPPNVLAPTEINLLHYCYWEAIGRARFNGETTSGVQSLAQYCKDGTIMFYIKNKLAAFGVVAIRPFTEIRQNHLNITYLLTLARFFRPDHSRLTTVVFKMYNLLKEMPGHLVPVAKIKKCFSFLDRNRDFKRISLSHVFRSVFEIRNPTEDEIPLIKNEFESFEGIEKNEKEYNYDFSNSNELPEKKKKKKKREPHDDANKTKIGPVVILRQPNKNLEDILQDKDERSTNIVYEENEDEYEFISDDSDYEKHTFVDMPLREEIYRAILRHGRCGCSQTQLRSYLNMHYLTVRQMLRGLLQSKVICRYCTDSGRQRIYMYVALEYGHQLKNVSNIENLDSLKCEENPKEPIISDTNPADIPNIIATIERVTDWEYTPLRRFDTLRDKMRKHTIIMALNLKPIIALPDAVSEVQKQEKDDGYKDEICRKSLKRLLYQLQEEKLINCYRITLSLNNTDRVQIYITHPKLTETHNILQQEIYRMKHSYYTQYEERRLREQILLQTQKQRLEKSLQRTQLRKIMQEKYKHFPSNNMTKLRQLYLRGAASQKPPKFLVSRCFHEFLYYLVVELGDCQIGQTINLDTLQYWQHSAPELDIRNFLEEAKSSDVDKAVLLYNKMDLNWRTFIPPLPPYSDKPCGWVYIPDALDRLPFTLFNKIFRLNKETNSQLIDYLHHPIRQHYLMRQLPLELQHCISRNYQQQIFSMILKLLNNMGLLQVHQLKGQSRDSTNMWVYLNRNVCIKDTTISPECYQEVEKDLLYDMLNITLHTNADLNKYWTSLHRICVYTKLGFRKNMKSETEYIKKRKDKEIDYLNTVQFNEAPKFDDAKIPGNGLGAAGLDSNMFAHVFRNWSWVTNVTSIAGKPKRRIRHCHVGTASLKNSKSNKSHLLKRNTKTVLAKKTKKKSDIKKSVPRDQIDIDALKNMRTLRVKWSPGEDQILKLTRAVYLFLEPPVNILGLLQVGKISRDLLRHCLGICNKTTQACVRRSKFLIKKKMHVPFVPTWLNMLQTNIVMQNSYGYLFLEELQELYSNKKQLAEVLEAHFLLITMFLLRSVVEGQKSNVLNSRHHNHKLILPYDVPEFHRQFKIRHCAIRSTNVEKQNSFTCSNPVNNSELEITQIMSVLHSLLCCTKDKTLYNMQAFDIFKNYSEATLKEAFAKARANSLVIAIKRRNLSTQPAHLAAPTYVLSNKYRMRLMYLKIPYEIFDGLYDFEQKLINNTLKRHNKFKAQTILSNTTKLGTNKIRKCKNGMAIDVKSVTSGQFFYIGEGLASQYWRMSVTLPTNILTFDTDQYQMGNSYDRIYDHHHLIFQHGPEPEYGKFIGLDINHDEKPRVKFSDSNLTYKIYYTPWDYVSKIPTYQLHFFCALDAMYQDVEIDLSNKEHTHQNYEDVPQSHRNLCSIYFPVCPFKSCIMEKRNYLDEIQRIVEERRSLLKNIREIPMENIKLEEFPAIVQIHPNNILTLIKSLSSTWQKHLHLIEQKDLGKLSIKPRVNEDTMYSAAIHYVEANKSENMYNIRRKKLCWLQICKDISDYNVKNEDEFYKSDDYEPTINKECFARIQDVLVINLPTLHICQSTKILARKAGMDDDSNFIPDSLLEMENKREKIFNKILGESIWKYTDNSFQTLDYKWKLMKLNTMEEQHLREIHDYIEAKILGADIEELRKLFPYENFLIRALEVLSENWLIKRVGVACRVYVHKSHIRPWVVQTFHVKRSEKESINTPKVHTSRKRQCDLLLPENENEIDLQPSCSKKAKISENNKNQKLKEDITTKKSITATEREVIVLRPQPWVRLNGSLNRRVLDRWLGSILIECVHRNGMLVIELCNRFPHMTPVDIMFLLEILSDLKCVQLKEKQSGSNSTLISVYKPYKEINVTTIYDKKKTYIYVTRESLTRMANFIGKKRYNSEFI